MCASIAHRGPDDQGVRIAEGVASEASGCSIIDLAGGNQPIRNEDGTLWIVFNGEIYNYPSCARAHLTPGRHVHALRHRVCGARV